MIPEDEARERVLEAIQALPLERVGLLDALGRHAGTDRLATVPLPGFDNSAMDGYALAFEGETAETGARFILSGEQPAGADRGLSLQPGQAARIFTGAPVPAGTSAVLMQEDAETADGAVIVREAVERGEFIRRAGGDLCVGQRILEAGEKITPQLIGLLASQGLGAKSELEVHRRPRVGIVATGDELVAAGRPLEAGEIYESNSLMLAALVRQTGAEVTGMTHCQDDLDATAAAIDTLLADCDVVILSGGVSVGERDFVKPALGRCGFVTDLWRVAIKPGKPFLFARRADGRVAFGLPGNPVSSLVTFVTMVAPALRKMAGSTAPSLDFTSATAADEMRNGDKRPHYLRGELRMGVFRAIGRQESHALFGLARSNALARVAAGTSIAGGGQVAVLRLGAG